MVLALRRSKAFAKPDTGTVGAHRLCAERADHVPSVYSTVRPQTISSGLCFLNFVNGEEFAQRKDLILKAEKTYTKESCAALFGQNSWEIG